MKIPSKDLRGVLVYAIMLTTGRSLVTAASSNCQTTCGNLTIPYPFGTTSECYLNEYFYIYCNTTSPDSPVPSLMSPSSGIEVLNISLDGELRVNTFISRDCYTQSGVQEIPWLAYTILPVFPFSTTRNKFTAVGCNTIALIRGANDDGFLSGCLSTCNYHSSITEGMCNGIGCCQTTIPNMLLNYNISVSSISNNTDARNFNPCSYAFIVEENSFKFTREDLNGMRNWTRVPSVLDWVISNQTCEEARKNSSSFACKANSECFYFENIPGYRCNCSKGYQGNPYSSNGCEDIDECETSNPCAVPSLCKNQPGSFSCSCPNGYEGDGKTSGTGCSQTKKNTIHVVALGLGVGMGCLLLLLCASWLALGLRLRKATKEKEKFFKDNGGLMLQRLISQQQSHVEMLKVFSAEELRNATDNFHESRILGQGGQGTVYKGTIMNSRTVAIKKAKMLDRNQVDDFINEIIVLSQINHKNVVKLIGCCLEVEIPLLVYEFVTNGTLYEHLHDNGRQSMSLSTWGARLRVAAEAAGALSYLHTDATIPIFHRDVKSANILLDENYTAKVSDFGASRLIPSDRTQLSTLVQGTFGYIDPEYFHTSQLTEKSDVYSFGVVLAELLTGMKAVSFNKPEKERNLSLFFVTAVKEDRCLEIIDKQIINEGNAKHVREAALLANRCLKIKGEDRPSMKEIALELEGLLRATDMHPWIHQDLDNLQETEFLLGDSQVDLTDTGAISIAVSEDTTKSQLLPFHIANAR